MINVTDKQKCCGCSACVQVCPKQCVSFEEDEKGFRYPQVDSTVCVNCGMCEKVCPILQVGKPRKPINVYAAVNPNEEIRMKSSSGGIFTLLAETIINEGGVVFGARFNEQLDVVHGRTEDIEGIAYFRGAKYVQSVIGNSYKQVRSCLQEGREVLFSGTPCQIAGLKNFLGKKYDNLLTVDVICHGVPSPKVWREYLTMIAGDKKNISYVNFREKSNGWKDYNLVVNKFQYPLIKESFKTNLYMQMFIKSLSLRPSCYRCKCKSGSCGSDLTIADFWGVSQHHSSWDDDKGTSLVLVNSENGGRKFSCLKLKYEQASYKEALKWNPNMKLSADKNKQVDQFWKSFEDSKFDEIPSILKEIKPSILRRIYRKIRLMK